MKRSHRRWHRWVSPIWLLGASAVVGLALVQRPAAAQNPVWPPMLAAVSA